MNYDRLSAQDNSFLLLEGDNVRMHVASVLVFDAGPLRTDDGGIDFKAIRQTIEMALPEIHRYRQRLAWIPLENHAVWVDDAHFDLEYHVRHTSLPKPGSAAQLKKLAARIMSQPLDRNRPLWETWVIEGLDGGDSFALLTKIHHCMIDGASGVDLAQVLLSASPDPLPVRDIPTYMPRPTPSALDLAIDEARRRLSLPGEILRGVRSFVDEAEDLRAEVEVRAKALLGTMGVGLSADETPLNGKLGPHRAFDWLDVPLDELKAVRRAWDCSINDVVLTIVTGAVRGYLIRRGVDPTSLEFKVSAPVSVRSEEEKGKLGNQVSSWILALPIHLEDPRDQLRAIHEETSRLKETRQALGVQMMMQVAEFTPSTLLSLGAQSLSGPIYTIVTNVPGPQIPLYCNGARLKALYPMVPLMENLGLGIALMSYAGSVGFGFNSDPDLVPDADLFVEKIRESLEAVKTAAVRAVPDPDEEAKPARPKQARAARTAQRAEDGSASGTASPAGG